MSNDTKEIRKMELDLAAYGTGALLESADGTVKHLPLDDFILVKSKDGIYIKLTKETSMKFMIGQRVIFRNVICIVCKPELNDSGKVWIADPEVGYKHWVSEDNLKPLPNGQL